METSEIGRLQWKGEVTFEGTIEEFHVFKAAIEGQPVRISVSEVAGGIKFKPRPGYISPPLISALEASRLEKITQGAIRMQFATIKDIAGGIRNPHLHLGDEVVLIDKTRFKTVIGEVARKALEHRVDIETDYYNMIKPIAEE